MVVERPSITALLTIMVRLTQMAQPLLVRLGRMATGCAIWQAMYGSGQVVVITQVAVMAIAFSTAAAGASTTTTVLSRSGTAASRAT
jgi:hypothetical protein